MVKEKIVCFIINQLVFERLQPIGMIIVMSIHWRLAELWQLQQSRKLTEDERSEMNCCMKLNANYAQKLAEQYNLGLMASMTNDWDWLHEVSAEIDKLETIYNSKKPFFFER